MEEDKGQLDELKRSLYRRGQGKRRPRPWARFTKKDPGVQSDWQHDHVRTSDVQRVTRPKRSRRNLSVRFFIFSVVFFLIALGVAAFIINRGSNLVSADNIDLSVSGPVSIAGGESLELQIDVINRNNTTLELVDLLIEFPEGARDTNGQDELRRLRESLGDLSPGEGESRTISALLFGEENSQQEIQVGIEYRVADSNAIFLKESVFAVQIGTAPISILVDTPAQIHSGEEITLVAEVISNASEPLEDVALSVEYPFGFSFMEAQPAADVGENIWLLGNLAPQDRRTVNIRGVLEGQDTEERTFRFIGGLSDGVDTQAVSTTLLDIKRSVAISRPFLQADLTLGGSSDEVYVAEAGQNISGVIAWQNNLPVTIEDAEIEVVLTGDVLDELSVAAQGGFYRSVDNTIFWDKSRYDPFDRLEPGARGQVTFSFSSVDPTSAAFQQGTIDIALRISGNRIGNTPETTGLISSSVERIVQFAGRADLGAQAVYSTGPFNNTGPIPPVAEQPTTYTVTWSVTNTSNDLLDGRVSAALPDYMEWVGVVSPSNESVTFNTVGSEVVWDLGTVVAGSGYTRPPREVSFQVRLIPSISQVGSTPVLVGTATFTAQDAFTGTTRRANSNQLTTAIAADPDYGFGDGQVIGG